MLEKKLLFGERNVSVDTASIPRTSGSNWPEPYQCCGTLPHLRRYMRSRLQTQMVSLPQYDVIPSHVVLIEIETPHISLFDYLVTPSLPDLTNWYLICKTTGRLVLIAVEVGVARLQPLIKASYAAITHCWLLHYCIEVGLVSRAETSDISSGSVFFRFLTNRFLFSPPVQQQSSWLNCCTSLSLNNGRSLFDFCLSTVVAFPL